MHNTLFLGTADGSGKKRENRAGYSSTHGTDGTGTDGTGTDGTGSAGIRRRLAGALAAVALVAVVVLAGCAEAGDTAAPKLAVTAGTVTIVSGQISIAVTNPNTGAVSVRVGINPAKAGATYAVNGSAVGNIETTGFALAASATQTLTIGSLTDGTTYAVGLTTVGSNGVAHSSVVNQSIALSAPTAFMVTAANGTVSSSAPNITVTLSWTNPNNATTVALGVLPTGATASPATPNTVAGASNSVTINGLAAETAQQTFTVTATNGIGSTTGTSSSITTAALPVVLWQASRSTEGGFGFTYCQTELSGGATDTSGVHKTLYDAGYRTAKFFGSTPDYDFNDIATDSDALGAVGTRSLVTAAGSSFTAREISSGVAMTLADFTKGANRNTGGDITNGAVRTVLDAVESSFGFFWSFSVRAGTYDTTTNCSGASSRSSSIDGAYATVGSSAILMGGSFDNCTTGISVLCIAK